MGFMIKGLQTTPVAKLWHTLPCGSFISAGRSGLTIHSSRTRFAGRLNSGVRPLRAFGRGLRTTLSLSASPNICSSVSPLSALMLQWCSGSASATSGSLQPVFRPRQAASVRSRRSVHQARPTCAASVSSGQLPASEFRWQAGGLTSHSSRARFGVSG